MGQQKIMADVTFITSNPGKAKVFADYMGKSIERKDIDLDEIQSLELRSIVEHKLQQAFEIVGGPVLIEDSGCRIDALGNFPGPFIKWMLQTVGLEGICRLVDGKNRGASADICFGYYDGKDMKFYEGSVHGTIPEHPKGDSGFGWNAVFIPDGDTQTYAESGKNFREITVFPQIKEFLTGLDPVE